MGLEQKMQKPLASNLPCVTDNMYFHRSSWHLFMKLCTEFSVLWKKTRSCCTMRQQTKTPLTWT